jgi:hypothetical protein
MQVPVIIMPCRNVKPGDVIEFCYESHKETPYDKHFPAYNHILS